MYQWHPYETQLGYKQQQLSAAPRSKEIYAVGEIPSIPRHEHKGH